MSGNKDAKKHVRYEGIPSEEPLRPRSQPIPYIRPQPHPQATELSNKKPALQSKPPKTSKSKKGSKALKKQEIPNSSNKKLSSSPTSMTKSKKNSTSGAPNKAFVITHSPGPSTPVSKTGQKHRMEIVILENKPKSKALEDSSPFPSVKKAVEAYSTSVKESAALATVKKVVKVSKGTEMTIMSIGAEWERRSRLNADSVNLPVDKKAGNAPIKAAKLNNPKGTKDKSPKKQSSGAVAASTKNSSVQASKMASISVDMSVSAKESKVRKEAWMSPAEAAARLSLPWPPKPAADAEAGEVNASSIKMNSSFMKEMNKFLKNHAVTKDLQKPGVVRGRGQLEDTLDAALESIKSAYLEKKLGKGQGKVFKPFVAPKWDEVQSNWPGFDHQPLPNWEKYAVPPKIDNNNNDIVNNNNDGGTNRPVGLKASTIKKTRGERVIEHSGGGCQF